MILIEELLRFFLKDEGFFWAGPTNFYLPRQEERKGKLSKSKNMRWEDLRGRKSCLVRVRPSKKSVWLSNFCTRRICTYFAHFFRPISFRKSWNFLQPSLSRGLGSHLTWKPRARVTFQRRQIDEGISACCSNSHVTSGLISTTMYHWMHNPAFSKTAHDKDDFPNECGGEKVSARCSNSHMDWARPKKPPKFWNFAECLLGFFFPPYQMVKMESNRDSTNNA